MSTIKSPRDIQTIFEDSKRVSHPLLIALIAPTPAGRGPGGRVVFVAGKRLGNAVVRNRAKRVLRAAVQRNQCSWPGYDVALIARAGTGTAVPADLDAALRSVLARGGLMPS